MGKRNGMEMMMQGMKNCTMAGMKKQGNGSAGTHKQMAGK